MHIVPYCTYVYRMFRYNCFTTYSQRSPYKVWWWFFCFWSDIEMHYDIYVSAHCVNFKVVMVLVTHIMKYNCVNGARSTISSCHQYTVNGNEWLLIPESIALISGRNAGNCCTQRCTAKVVPLIPHRSIIGNAFTYIFVLSCVWLNKFNSKMW